jgi:putative oxidoreductase
MKAIFDLLGRALLSVIFFFEAYDSIRYFHQTKETMTEFGINWRQDLLLSAAIGVLILGAVLILFGYRSKLGATLLLFYWVPVTFIAEAFWQETGVEFREASISFMKNIAIIGGLLMIYVNGAGKYSIKRLFATSRVPGA